MHSANNPHTGAPCLTLEKLAMKKSLIAIAALAAAGAAAAQSSVTMYGQVNTGYGYNKQEIRVGDNKATTKKTGVITDRVNSSRLGFKGQEALGNGLSATFALEMGFDSANGKFDDSAFSRRAVVGLKGAFGEVRIGKDSTPMNEFSGSYKAIDATNTLISSVPEVLTSETELKEWAARPTGVFYNGSFGGVDVGAAIGHENTTNEINGTTDNKNKTSVYGLGLNYSAGAWAVGAAFQHDTVKRTGFVAPATNANIAKTNYGLGASYDFGVAKLYGEYKGGRLKDKDANEKLTYNQYAVGVGVPFGATTLSAEYGYNQGKYTSGVDSIKFKGNVFAVQAEYAFSKRTSIYARAGQVGEAKVKGENIKATEQEYTIGLRHKF